MWHQGCKELWIISDPLVIPQPRSIHASVSPSFSDDPRCPLLIESGAQAAPILGLTVQSGGQSSFQSVALGSTGGSYNFAPVSVGNFTSNNIGTQLFSPDYIDLATFDLSSRSGGTLIITLTGTGFTTPVGASSYLTQFTGNVANGTATVTAQSYLDNSDTLNNPGCAVGCTLLSSVNLGGSATGSAVSDGSFALTEVITITTQGNTQLSLDASVSNTSSGNGGGGTGTSVPEPMSLALLGTGLAGIGLIRRNANRKIG